jgi:hypothetical protein
MFRRRFLEGCAALAAASLLKGQGQSENPGATPLQPKLVKEFRNAYLMAVSPDGAKVCLYFTKHPLMTFTFPPPAEAALHMTAER